MNEKIKKLKLQAGINDNPDQEGLDLFAELIIKECATVANCPSSFKQTNGYKILRHFGLDEELVWKVFLHGFKTTQPRLPGF